MSNSANEESRRISRKYGREHPRIVANLADRPANITLATRRISPNYRKNIKKAIKKGKGGEN